MSQRLKGQWNSTHSVDAHDIITTNRVGAGAPPSRAKLDWFLFIEPKPHFPGPAVFKVRSKKSAVALYALIQLFHIKKSWISSGKISSSNLTC